MQGVRNWLESLGLDEYVETFADNAIDESVLGDLTDQDLKELGVAKLGHRKKLLKAIRQHSAEGGRLRRSEPNLSDSPVSQSEAERRQITVLFCDLVGSTQLSQQLDPEEMRDVLRAYQDSVSGSIARYQGHVAKFLGDGVLAYFGWPHAHEDQAERAVRAGLDAVSAVQSLNLANDIKLDARVGISSGLVVVGDLIGDVGRDADAVIGETPNLAARLQSEAKPGQVVIGPLTYLLVQSVFELRTLGKRHLKGFDQPIAVWQVEGESSVETRFEAVHGRTRMPFVGREGERQLLFDRWALAKGGEGQTVLMSGEAGIGKSRLLLALRQEIGSEAHFHLRYQCSPYHTNSAFYPIVQRLIRAARIADDDNPEVNLDKLEALIEMSREPLEEVVPYLAMLLALPWQQRYHLPELTSQQIRDRTIEALIGQVLSLSRLRPVVWLFEDAHWIDPSTEALLFDFIARIRDAAVLIVVTHRPEYTPPWPHQQHVTTIVLNRLSREQGAQIVRSIIGDEVDGDMLNQIVVRADGVPLYIEEMAKSVLEAGETNADQGRDIPIPNSLQATLTERLDRLGEAKKVAQIASVIGREFDFRLLSAVYDGSDLDERLEQLLASELIYRVRSGPDAVYLFKHALVQNAGYDSLLRADCRIVHAHVAEAIKAIYPERADTSPELLAVHYTQAESYLDAVKSWLSAGLRANDQSAYLEAIGHLKMALQGLVELSEEDERDSLELQIQTALASAYLATDGFTASTTASAYGRAREICNQLGDDDQIFPILYGTFRYLFVSGKHDESAKLAEEMLARARQQTNPIHLVMSHRVMGSDRFARGQLQSARKHLEKALSVDNSSLEGEASAVYGADYRTSYLAHLAPTLALLGDVNQATTIAEAEIKRTCSLKHAFAYCHALTWFGMTYAATRQFERIHQRSEELVELAKTHGFDVWTSLGQALLGAALVSRGEIDEGIAQMRAGLTALLGRGGVFTATLFRPLLAEALANSGHLDEATKLVADTLDVVDSTNERWCEAEALRMAGRLKLMQQGTPDPAEAELLYRRSIKVAANQGATLWQLRSSVSLCQLLADRGDRQQASDLLRPVLASFTEDSQMPDLVEARTLLTELN